MKYTIKYLRQLLADNDISGYNERTCRLQLLGLLFEKGTLGQEDVFPIKKPIEPQYERRRKLQAQPRQVTFTDIETGQVTTYDSMHQAAKVTGYTRCRISKQERDGKYTISVAENEIC